MAGDNAKSRATALPHLEWQGELDTALAEIDNRLTHPRRRASDRAQQPILPELGQVPITSELLDEIAWRVAQQMQRTGQVVSPDALANALSKPEPGPAPAPPPAQTPDTATQLWPFRSEAAVQGLMPGKVLLIRFKPPSLPWPLRLFQRRRKKQEHPLTTARLRG